MKNILSIIIAVLVTAVASSSITYFVTIDKNGEKEDAKVNVEFENNNDNSFSSRPLTGQDQIVTGSSSINAVEIKSAELTKTANGEDAIIITFVYSRLSGYAECFSYAVSDLVHQNGVELESVYSSDFEYDVNLGDRFADVKAGYSNEIRLAFLLNDSESDVVVECEGDGDYSVSRVFEMN